MTIAHFSDVHLGFRAYARTHSSGLNQREVDVMLSFRATLESILSYNPDLVVFAGDMFHVVRPSNYTIIEADRAIDGFQRRRNGAPFVWVGGNHDSPKNAEMGNIQGLFANIDGVYFAGNMAKRFPIPELDLEVLCVPSNSLVAREEVAFKPTLDATYSVLAVHGMAVQALPKAVESVHADFDVNDLHSDLFTYTALGDFHGFTEYAPNCCFSGSTDLTTTNIWDELGHPKGWVLYDTETGKLQHIPIPNRPAIDLPVIDAALLSIDEIREMMRGHGEILIGEPIARQRIINLHRDDKRALFSTSLIREISARCLNYQVATTPAAVSAATVVLASGVDATGAPVSATLEAQWAAHCKGASVPKSVDRETLVRTGVDLLKAPEVAA
jgi:DNA repair protein SbcD/Mre11